MQNLLETSLLVLAGMGFVSAILFFSIAWRSKRGPTHIFWFACLSLGAGVYGLQQSAFYGVQTVPAYFSLLRWEMWVVAYVGIASLWFVASYTETRPPRPLLWCLTTVLAFLPCVRVFHPWTLLYSAVSGIHRGSAWWGPSVSVDGTPTLVLPVYLGFLLLMPVLQIAMVLRSQGLAVRTRRRLLLALAAFLALVLWDCAVLLGALRLPYLGEFSLFAFLWIAGSALVSDYLAAEEAQRQLLVHRHNFEQIFNNAFQFVGLLDLEGRLIEANQTALRFAGLSLEQVRGRFFWECPWWTHDPVMVARLRTAVAEARQTRQLVRFEATHLNTAGELRQIDCSLRTLLAPDGSLQGLIPEGRDITEFKRAEESLVREKAFSDAVINGLPGAFFMFRRDGRLVRWNAEYARVTGVNPATAEQYEFLSRIADEDKVRVSEAVERVFREGGAAIEANVVDLTGRHVPFDFAACRLQIGDQIYLVGTAYDITVRRQAEERLRQGEKMRVLGQMASGIAHDFNNLLGGVIGFAEVLKASVGEDPQLVECADKILTSANRAAAITMKLRTFSRQSPFVLAPVDLHQVIEEAVELLRHTIGAHIPIVRHLDAAEAVVQGDAAEIQSAIMNLGMNARDAMPRGGTVTVATKVLELQAPLRLAQDFELPVGRYIELSVADTGTGMDAAVQSRLFEPFFTTKGVGKGTGLGLANVFGCMKQHQGAIGVHSEPGRGTTFRLVFPLVRQG